MKLVPVSTFIALTLVACLAFADDDEFIFGPEFTFSNNLILKAIFPEKIYGENEDPEIWEYIHESEDAFAHNLLERMKRHLVDGQEEDSQFIRDYYSFMSPNGWVFSVMTDLGVVEVTMNPMTVEEFKQYKHDIQDAIFVSAANEDLFPFDYLGGGHISIGLEAFLNKPLLLRNFIVDYMNHAELSLGVMSYDSNNALPVALFSPERQLDIISILAKFDQHSGRYWTGDLTGLYRFIHDVGIVGRDDLDDYAIAWEHEEKRFKHRALNLSHFSNTHAYTRRIELRSIRPQKSMDIFVRQIELLRERIRYLETLDHPIPLKFEVPILQQKPFGTHKLNPPVSPQAALKAFYRYVTESGLEWKDHTDYLWPKWIEDGEVEKFEQSEFFIKQQAKKSSTRSCLEVLEGINL